jgi:DNA-binding NarL/FixJ family response regulator
MPGALYKSIRCLALFMYGLNDSTSMKTIVSLLYNYPISEPSGPTAITDSCKENKGRFVLFHYHPSLPLEKVQAELANIKFCFGEETKVIISSEEYVDEFVQQCDSMLYDAYVLNSDDREVLNQAAENMLAGNFYLSKNVLKAYFKSRRREYGYQ